MKVRCLDGKTRICRIPGRMKRYLWVREGDYVVVDPWEFSDDKGDIVYKYTFTQAQWLKNKGHLKKLDEFQEF
jgi:translation initiation factor 1A